MAQLLTAAFDRLWDQAQPYADLVFAGSDLPTVNTPRQEEGS